MPRLFDKLWEDSGGTAVAEAPAPVRNKFVELWNETVPPARDRSESILPKLSDLQFIPSSIVPEGTPTPESALEIDAKKERAALGLDRPPQFPKFKDVFIKPPPPESSRRKLLRIADRVLWNLEQETPSVTAEPPTPAFPERRISTILPGATLPDTWLPERMAAVYRDYLDGVVAENPDALPEDVEKSFRLSLSRDPDRKYLEAWERRGVKRSTKDLMAEAKQRNEAKEEDIAYKAARAEPGREAAILRSGKPPVPGETSISAQSLESAARADKSVRENIAFDAAQAEFGRQLKREDDLKRSMLKSIPYNLYGGTLELGAAVASFLQGTSDVVNQKIKSTFFYDEKTTMGEILSDEEAMKRTNFLTKSIQEYLRENPDLTAAEIRGYKDLLEHPGLAIAATARTVPYMAVTMALTMAGLPTAAFTFTLMVEGGNARQDALADGKSPEEATAIGMVYGPIAAAIEVAQVSHFVKFINGSKASTPLKRAFRKALMRKLGPSISKGVRVGADFLATAAKEGSEEVVQSAWQEISNYLVTGKTRANDFGEFIDQAGVEFLIAALATIPMAGAPVSVRAIVRKAQKLQESHPALPAADADTLVQEWGIHEKPELSAQAEQRVAGAPVEAAAGVTPFPRTDASAAATPAQEAVETPGFAQGEETAQTGVETAQDAAQVQVSEEKAAQINELIDNLSPDEAEWMADRMESLAGQDFDPAELARQAVEHTQKVAAEEEKAEQAAPEKGKFPLREAIDKAGDVRDAAVQKAWKIEDKAERDAAIDAAFEIYKEKESSLIKGEEAPAPVKEEAPVAPTPKVQALESALAKVETKEAAQAITEALVEEKAKPAAEEKKKPQRFEGGILPITGAPTEAEAAKAKAWLDEQLAKPFQLEPPGPAVAPKKLTPDERIKRDKEYFKNKPKPPPMGKSAGMARLPFDAGDLRVAVDIIAAYVEKGVNKIAEIIKDLAGVVNERILQAAWLQMNNGKVRAWISLEDARAAVATIYGEEAEAIEPEIRTPEQIAAEVPPSEEGLEKKWEIEGRAEPKLTKAQREKKAAQELKERELRGRAVEASRQARDLLSDALNNNLTAEQRGKLQDKERRKELTGEVLAAQREGKIAWDASYELTAGMVADIRKRADNLVGKDYTGREDKSEKKFWEARAQRLDDLTATGARYALSFFTGEPTVAANGELKDFSRRDRKSETGEKGDLRLNQFDPDASISAFAIGVGPTWNGIVGTQMRDEARGKQAGVAARQVDKQTESLGEEETQQGEVRGGVAERGALESRRLGALAEGDIGKKIIQHYADGGTEAEALEILRQWIAAHPEEANYMPAGIKAVEPSTDQDRAAIAFAKSLGIAAILVEIDGNVAGIGIRGMRLVLVNQALSGQITYTLMGHEISHAAGLDKKMLVMTDRAKVEDAERRYLDNYRNAFGDAAAAALAADKERLAREGMAMLIGEALNDFAVLARLRLENPSLWKRIWEEVKAIFRRIAGKVTLSDNVVNEFRKMMAEEGMSEAEQVAEITPMLMPAEPGKGKPKTDAERKAELKARVKAWVATQNLPKPAVPARPRVNPAKGKPGAGYAQAMQEELPGEIDTITDVERKKRAQFILDQPLAKADLTKKIMRGGSLVREEVEAAKQIISEAAVKARRTGSSADNTELHQLMNGYAEEGTDVSQKMAARRMPSTRQERQGHALTELLNAPNPRDRDNLKRLEGIVKSATASDSEKVDAQKRIDKIMEDTADLYGKMKKALKKKGIDLDAIDAMSEKQREEYLSDLRTWNKITTVSQTYRANWADKTYEYWINGLISAFVTQKRNIIGNFTHVAVAGIATRNVERTINEIIHLLGYDYAKGAPTFGEFREFMKAFGPSFALAYNNMVLAWRMQAPVLEIEHGEEGGGKVPTFRTKAIKGRLGFAVRLPGGFLQAADEFVKGGIATMRVYGQAHNAGVRQGLKGEALDNFIAKEVANPYSESWKLALEEARYITYQEEGGPLVKGLSQLSYKISRKLKRVPIPIINPEYLSPFIRITGNLMKTALRYTPLDTPVFLAKLATFGFSESYRHSSDLAARNLIRNAAEQIVGLALTVFVFSLPDEDEDGLPYFTGTAPYTLTSKGERLLGYRSVPPGHIKVPFTRFYWDVSNYEPFSTNFMTMVDLKKAYKRLKSGESSVAEEVFREAVATATQLKEQTFMRGPAEAMDALMREKSIADYLAGFLASFSPNILKRGARTTDPNIRETHISAKAFGDEWYKQAWTMFKYEVLPLRPGGKEGPYSKVNLWGQDVTKQGGIIQNLLASNERRDRNLIQPWDRALINWKRTHPDAELPGEMQSWLTYTRASDGKKMRIDLTLEERYIMEKMAGATLLFFLSKIEKQTGSTLDPKNPSKKHIQYLYGAVDAARQVARETAEVNNPAYMAALKEMREEPE